MGGEHTPPQEENAELPNFTPKSAHILLRGVYGGYPHHNDGSHMDGGITDNAIWQRCWRRLAAQLDSWYSTPSGAVGHRFTAILAAKCRGVLRRNLNFERPCVFAHTVLIKMIGVRRTREIQARITIRMDLCERVLHAGLV